MTSTEILGLAQAYIAAEDAFRLVLLDKLQQDIADRPFWRVARSLR